LTAALSELQLKTEKFNVPSAQIAKPNVEEQIIAPSQVHVVHEGPNQIVPAQVEIEESKVATHEGTYVFCYGSNHPVAMAKMFN